MQVVENKVVGAAGLEPATLCLEGRFLPYYNTTKSNKVRAIQRVSGNPSSGHCAGFLAGIMRTGVPVSVPTEARQ